MASPKWRTKSGLTRLSQDLRIKSEQTTERVFKATENAASIGEAAMKRQIMTSGTEWRRTHPTHPSPGRYDPASNGRHMVDAVGSKTSRKQTSVEATFGYQNLGSGDFYFIFQEEGFNYVHGKNPHWVPGVHAQIVGAVRAREYLQAVLKSLGLRRKAGSMTSRLPNPKYGG